MDPNTNTLSLREKVGNAFYNLKQMMSADKRVLFSVLGVGVLVIIFFTIFIVSFLSSSNEKSLVTSETPNGSVSQSLKKRISSKPKASAKLSMVLSNKKNEYKVGDEISFTIVADSAGNQVRGYDAFFKYDATKVSFVSEKNLYPAFAYQKRLRPNWVMITAIESVSANKKVVFSQTPLMGITFKAVAPGSAYFPFSYIPGSFNDSNLIDISSNDMLSNATGIVIEITP